MLSIESYLFLSFVTPVCGLVTYGTRVICTHVYAVNSYKNCQSLILLIAKFVHRINATIF